jgi:prepilin-type N-terminal cleavage/methylation domain-containing protein
MRAFTLIEMLVVIAVMSILAALIFPVTKAVNRNKLRSRAKAELAQIETAIERYKTKLGYYPPSSRDTNSPVSQLYYELVGTTSSGSGRRQMIFQTLDGGTRISSEDLFLCFGVDGLANSAPATGGDEVQPASSFLKGIAPTQTAFYTNRSGVSAKVLVAPAVWPERQGVRIAGNPRLNPCGYNSSGPKFNVGSYDLWMDLFIDGKTNRICNWSKEPLINPPPYEAMR